MIRLHWPELSRWLERAGEKRRQKRSWKSRGRSVGKVLVINIIASLTSIWLPLNVTIVAMPTIHFTTQIAVAMIFINSIILRCVTSWALSQPGLSQSWVPTPHSRGKTLLPEVRVWWPLKRWQLCLFLFKMVALELFLIKDPVSGSKCAFDWRQWGFPREGGEAGRTTSRGVLAHQGEDDDFSWRLIWYFAHYLEENLHIKVRMTMMICMETDMIFCTLSSYSDTPNIIILNISGSWCNDQRDLREVCN